LRYHHLVEERENKKGNDTMVRSPTHSMDVFFAESKRMDLKKQKRKIMVLFLLIWLSNQQALARAWVFKYVLLY